MTEKTLKNRDYYKEKYRPQIHFSPVENWMNDPNGLVYYKEKYHLFYQYHPYSNVWGPMHWGHAISTDLLHWQHLPIALDPDKKNGMAFSGTAVVDFHNSSGFFKDKSGLVLIYTSTLPDSAGGHQQQCIAYSQDDGLTWQKYKSNPVIKNKSKKDFRDPKVFWHQQTNKWIMVLVAGDRVEFYNSSNLREWKYLSEFGQNRGSHGGVWECPDFFPLQLKNHKYWILKVDVQQGAYAGGSGGQYFIGEFNGYDFVEINDFNQVNWLDCGQDFYAAQSWNELPENSGRKIWLAWMSNWDYANQVPTNIWKGAMSIPRYLELTKEKNIISLVQKPVKELEDLRCKEYIYKDLSVKKKGNLYFHNLKNPLEIDTAISLDENTKFDIIFEFKGNNLNLSYDNNTRQLILDRKDLSDGINSISKTKQITNLDNNNQIKLHIFIDWSSIEIFINEGKKVITALIFPEKVKLDLNFKNDGNSFLINNLKIYELESIWKNSY
ncbi:glycoside hydrolase family 32 protein [Halanaerobium salsuginis]|jgi:fructan beta-fructosidase|uniref:Fructan beta-fructosidase n=1 Tax=Halanaerobium salsuginis TaxID=29563 RepID=A0A1I4GRF5_9FIRM|nr:glycoside hydrolase family 32 protein [Halanaerobium salsuginis]SFL31751.1 fructan beta-fructosidase [Halanaerobium salsuginis]